MFNPVFGAGITLAAAHDGSSGSSTKANYIEVYGGNQFWITNVVGIRADYGHPVASMKPDAMEAFLMPGTFQVSLIVNTFGLKR